MEWQLVIFLQFTRPTGHPHPRVEVVIKNYEDLLIKIGHREHQVSARLKHLAPEMFP